MEENVIPNNSGIMRNLDSSVESVIYVKKFFWNPATYNCENRNYLAGIIDNSAIMCDKVIKSYDEETSFNEKSNLLNAKFLYFTCILINYCSIIDSC